LLEEQLLISAGVATVAVDAAVGGRIGQINVGAQPLLVPADPDRSPTISWGSFPMVPWAGRIRHGRFTFDGVEHQLERNHVDVRPGRSGEHAHAIHGTVFGRAWTVEERSDDAVSLHCSLTGALAWPFEGLARQRIEVSSGEVRCTLAVESLGHAFPAVIGWHPWFLQPTTLRFHPRAMYARDDDGITTGVLIDPVPPPWDDCFLADEPVALVYDRAEAPVVTVSSDCDHWVLFDGIAGALCVEPQSGPPDGPNVAPHVVRPGEPLTRSMRISW
jgi:aldose 1-epimerase